MTGLSWAGTMTLARIWAEIHCRRVYVYAVRTKTGGWIYVFSELPKKVRW